MSEDDTFRILSRMSFAETARYWVNNKLSYRLKEVDVLLKVTGWTSQELLNEARQQVINKGFKGQQLSAIK